MDLVASCRVFIYVAERGSFTDGAAAARVPQSVASRRVGALEERLGAPLFDRSARRAVLTSFGRDMLPPAKRLVQLAEEMEYHAERSRLRPLSLAVPEVWTVRGLAFFDASARKKGTSFDIRTANPRERAEMLQSGRVQAAVIAVPPEGADWTVPLGAAASSPGSTSPLRIGDLRPRRGQRSPQRIVIQPEDDIPHVRDVLQRAGYRAALLPAQVTVAASLIAAVSEAIRAGDFLLCPAAQAAELGLTWRPLAPPVTRGYSVSALTSADAERVRASLEPHAAQIVGAPAAAGEREGGKRP